MQIDNVNKFIKMPNNLSTMTVDMIGIEYARSYQMKIFFNYIYEFKKGVRQMILQTINIKYLDIVTKRLEGRNIDYVIQDIGKNKFNVFFGNEACIKVVNKMIIGKTLTELSPEEDFILGTMLGYDVCEQCSRYCHKKSLLRGV